MRGRSSKADDMPELAFKDLAQMHGDVHRLEDILLPKAADREALAAEQQKIAALIPGLLRLVTDPNPNVSWFAGHLLYHVREQGGREAFEKVHSISLDLFGVGMKGAVIVEGGRLVENQRFSGGGYH